MAIEKIINVVLTEEQHEALKKVSISEQRSTRSMAAFLINKGVRELEVEINKLNG